jgi:type II secretory pathway pseudopilin PulG
MRKAIAAAAVLALMSGVSLGQGSLGTTEKDANKHVDKPGFTNCPKDNPADAQSTDKTAIVPNAGGSQHSGAPTVQRDGKAVEVDPRCGQDPKQKTN